MINYSYTSIYIYICICSLPTSDQLRRASAENAEAFQMMSTEAWECLDGELSSESISEEDQDSTASMSSRPSTQVGAAGSVKLVMYHSRTGIGACRHCALPEMPLVPPRCPTLTNDFNSSISGGLKLWKRLRKKKQTAKTYSIVFPFWITKNDLLWLIVCHPHLNCLGVLRWCHQKRLAVSPKFGGRAHCAISKYPNQCLLQVALTSERNTYKIAVFHVVISIQPEVIGCVIFSLRDDDESLTYIIGLWWMWCNQVERWWHPRLAFTLVHWTLRPIPRKLAIITGLISNRLNVLMSTSG